MRGDGKMCRDFWVDVMLVLLIVFMVTAPLLVTGLRIDLPEVQATNMSVKNAKLIVSVTSDERILFGEEDVTKDLEEELRTNPGVQKEHELYIPADKAAHYGVVARAVAAARSAGVTSLNLLVEPEIEETGHWSRAPSAQAKPSWPCCQPPARFALLRAASSFVPPRSRPLRTLG
jgi:biopolymer transport protein TolR